MMVKFKPEFESELKRLKVKKIFIENVLAVYNDSYKTIPMHIINALNSRETFKRFVYSAFIFEDTPQGESFWITVSDGRHVSKFKQ